MSTSTTRTKRPCKCRIDTSERTPESERLTTARPAGEDQMDARSTMPPRPAKRAAAIPSDAPVIMHGIEKELDRPVYGMADHWFKGMPVVGTLWARGGGVAADPENAYRLLREQKQLALVFPEGSKGPGKTYGERYQLRRVGRGGFVGIPI